MEPKKVIQVLEIMLSKTRICKSIVAVLFVLAAGMGHGMQLHAMQQQSNPKMLTDNNPSKGHLSNEFQAAALQKILVVDLQNVTLEQGLKTIARKAGLKLVYSKNIIPANKQISLEKKVTTLESTLWALLAGTNLQFGVSSNNHLVIMKRTQEDKKTVQQAQQETITGTVTDSNTGNTLPGVNIVVKGTSTGASTDSEGNFELTVESLQDTLVVSYIGYQTKEVPINGRTELDIQLASQAITGEEMVVVGYGRQTKSSVTGSISSISTDKITQAPTASIGNALSGKLPGLQTIQRSGQPGGDAPEIYLRGVASLSEGLSHPIFVLDGVIQPNAQAINQLDPNIIKNVSVLKDASATAVYGVEGANGAIVVETKRGHTGEMQISLSTTAGLQSPTFLPEFANSYQTALAYNEAQVNDGVDPNQVRFSDKALKAFRTGSDPLIYPDMDWVDYMTKPTAFQSRTNVNISGGTDNVRYFISGGFLKQEGFFKTFEANYDYNPSFNRYNFQSNVDVDVTPTTTISLTAGGRVGKRVRINSLYGNMWYQIYRSPPYSGAGLVDGKLVDSGSGTFGSNQYIPGFTENIFRRIYGQGYRQNTSNVLNLNLSGKQELDSVIKGLEFQVKGAYNLYFTQNKTRNSSVALYHPYYLTDVDPSATGDSTVVFQKSGSDDALGYSENYNRERDWYIEARLNYNHDFGPHNVKGLLLYNQRKNYYPNEYTGIPRGLVSTVGRVNYNFSDRYLFEFSVGYNGSENFAQERRFGLFPAVSGGWILTNEPYMPDIPYLDYFKIRASYGIVGNDSGIGRFLYLTNQYNASSAGYNFGIDVPQNKPGASEGRIGNPEVTWERSEKQNYGFDLRMFDTKLDISFDYFHEYRSNILTTLNTVPAYVSANLPAVNVGEVENQGYEVQAKWKQQFSDFFYSIGGNISYAHNEIIYMDEVTRSEPYLRRTGNPVGQPFGYVFDRYYTEEDFKAGSDIPTPPYPAKPGDLKYKDLNGDGVVNSDDQRAIGYPEYPEYTFGAYFGFGYKNFDLTLQWAGATHTSRALDFAPYRVPFGGGGQLNIAAYQYEKRWTPERGQSAEYPRLSLNSRGRRVSYTSDYWLKDASYIRLKNAQVGYNLPTGVVENIGLKNMRLYLSGYNLLTVSKLDFIDPEQTGNPQQARYPVMKVYNFGINIGF